MRSAWPRTCFYYYWHDPGQDRGILLEPGRSDDDRAAELRAMSSHLRFLKTDQLNRQLHDLLLEFNYDAADLEFLPAKAKVMPLGKGRSASQNWERYYADELFRQTRHQERYLLVLFPEFLPDALSRA